MASDSTVSIKKSAAGLRSVEEKTKSTNNAIDLDLAHLQSGRGDISKENVISSCLASLRLAHQ